MLKREEINIRDPYILLYRDEYYLYGTRGATCFGEADGFDCYVSRDLTSFEGPFPVFQKPADFLPHRDYWAPEVIFENGFFYMFASFYTDGVGRGTHCLRAESPLGPFHPYSDGSLTKKEWACLDGTFYRAENGQPYLVFCHEWEQNDGVGTICAAELSEDFRSLTKEPRCLFSAKEASPPVAPHHHARRGDVYVTDGPFLYRDSKGTLHLLWSSFSSEGYCLAVAHSDNNEITGVFRTEPKLLFTKDGGHGMLFIGRDGELYLTLHSPNETLLERPIFIRLKEEDLCGNN